MDLFSVGGRVALMMALSRQARAARVAHPVNYGPELGHEGGGLDLKRAWAAVVMVGLAAFSCSAGGTTSPADPTTVSSASTSESELIAPACATYQDFVTYAHHDILKGTRSDAEIVKRLAKYQDSLEAGAHALTNERYRDAGHAALGMADAIGHLKNSIASFGPHSGITASAIRKAGTAGQQLLAFC